MSNLSISARILVSFLIIIMLSFAPVIVFVVFGYQISIISVFAILIAIISIAAILSTYVSRTIVTPLRQLIACKKEIAKGNIAIHADIKSKDEMGQNANALNEVLRLMNEVHNRFAVMKQHVNDGKTHYQMEESDLEGIYRDIIADSNNILVDYVRTLDYITESYVYIDKDMKVMHANLAARKLNGTENLDWDHIVGSHIDEFVSADISILVTKSFNELR